MNTIVGLATSISNSAVNIIRISGNQSVNIIEKIFHTNTKSSLNPNEIKHGFIKYNEEVFDEVLVSFMKAPKSYTGEDVIEINCHGGILVTNKILNLVISLGAKLAEPGEFTKRAFLNGKIDLTKAEAIMDLIYAKSDLELKCAINQTTGKLYKKLNFIKEKIVNILSHVEVIIDFEDEVEDVYKSDIENDIIKIINEVQEILKYKDQGVLIKQGIKTCIVGKPNVGKSSLLNYLCNEKKAIVTDIPGTTRDIIEEKVDIGGIILNLFDTAGIRESSDVVESIGINMAKDKIKESDLIFFVLDLTRDLDEEDFRIYELIKDKNIIFLLNKCEKINMFDTNEIFTQFKNSNEDNLAKISIKENLGFDKLTNLIKDKFLLSDLSLNTESIILTNNRHTEAFNNCLEFLNDSLKSLKDLMPLDIVSIDIRKALKYIMNITGEDINEVIVDNIFSKFCIGK